MVAAVLADNPGVRQISIASRIDALRRKGILT